MADTRIQLEVESFIRDERLLPRFRQKFDKRELQLLWGGRFRSDAVSEDQKIAVCISTATSQTTTGKLAVGKYHKIRADALFLQAAVGIARRVLVFSDTSMAEHFKNEQRRGRFPLDIDIVEIKLPAWLQKKLNGARNRASDEMT